MRSAYCTSIISVVRCRNLYDSFLQGMAALQLGMQRSAAKAYRPSSSDAPIPHHSRRRSAGKATTVYSVIKIGHSSGRRRATRFRRFRTPAHRPPAGLRICGRAWLPSCGRRLTRGAGRRLWRWPRPWWPSSGPPGCWVAHPSRSRLGTTGRRLVCPVKAVSS